VPRVHRVAVQGVLGGLLRSRVQGAARRGLRCLPGGLPRHVQELGLPDQAADPRRLPHGAVSCGPARHGPASVGVRLMCRHLAYLGPPASLRSLLIDPPHSLYRQAWAPRLQQHGTVNADGFGVGWYAAGEPVPARYRRAVPVWGDPSLPDIARVTRSGAVLAAVRSATEGTALGEAAAAPFGAGPWLFSHNGLLDGWPGAAAVIAERASAG